MAEIVVLFDTDDYRGDHAADVTRTKIFEDGAPISALLDEAWQLRTSTGDLATIRIVPVVREPTDG